VTEGLEKIEDLIVGEEKVHGAKKHEVGRDSSKVPVEHASSYICQGKGNSKNV